MISKVTNYLEDRAEKILFKAIKNNDLGGVKKQLQKGVDIDTMKTAGYTPLMDACSHGHLEIVKFLVENRAELDITCKDNMTALACAVQHNRYYIADYLLFKGADVNIGSIYGDTISNYASRMFNESMVELFGNHHKNLIIRSEKAEQERIENEKIERNIQISKHKEVLLQMGPNDITAPENAQMLQEIVNGGMLPRVFEGLDYEKQNALLVATAKDVMANADLAIQIQTIMQKTLTKERASKASVAQLGIYRNINQLVNG